MISPSWSRCDNFHASVNISKRGILNHIEPSAMENRPALLMSSKGPGQSSWKDHCRFFFGGGKMTRNRWFHMVSSCVFYWKWDEIVFLIHTTRDIWIYPILGPQRLKPIQLLANSAQIFFVPERNYPRVVNPISHVVMLPSIPVITTSLADVFPFTLISSNVGQWHC